jgi:hypothetical protein
VEVIPITRAKKRCEVYIHVPVNRQTPRSGWVGHGGDMSNNNNNNNINNNNKQVNCVPRGVKNLTNHVKYRHVEQQQQQQQQTITFARNARRN